MQLHLRIANADIYFDDTLSRLGDVTYLNLTGRLLALLKWHDPGEKWERREEGEGSIYLTLRTDSQDAWVFQPPVINMTTHNIPRDTNTNTNTDNSYSVNNNIIAQSDFYLGIPRCDNRIAEIFISNGYIVLNPTFAVHAIEIHNSIRKNSPILCTTKGAVHGKGRDILLSDIFIF